tara:strand:- start:291 stop:575 length:285 start_codon:yes stop_codon:yes gene_type:complete
MFQIRILIVYILGISSGFLTFSPLTRKIGCANKHNRLAVLDPYEEEDDFLQKKKFRGRRFRDIGKIYNDENLIRMQEKVYSIFNTSDFCNITYK